MAQLEHAAPRSRLSRFNEIVTILIRADAWGLVRKMTSPPAEGEESDAPVKLRMLLEDLGPSFIKIGQLLATRPDLISADYAEELKKLYDKTTPSPYEEVRHVIRSELGRDVEQVFASFEPEALASASIGQVHRATLRDGSKVAVK